MITMIRFRKEKNVEIVEKHHVLLDAELKYVADIVKEIITTKKQVYIDGEYVDVVTGLDIRWRAKAWRLYDAPTWILLALANTLMPGIAEKIPQVLASES